MQKRIIIDEAKCDGCGLCIPSCAEGALRIVDGKARLVDEQACDGLGHCLGACPRGAITIVDQPAACACLGSALRAVTTGDSPGLAHWPVQLHLLPVDGPLWQDADVLIAADCVGYAIPDFHRVLLGSKTLAIGCPKLDDLEAYTTKLTAVFRRHRIRSISVARMEVPCCNGIVAAVMQAIAAAERSDLVPNVITIGIDGRVLSVA